MRFARFRARREAAPSPPSDDHFRSLPANEEVEDEIEATSSWSSAQPKEPKEPAAAPDTVLTASLFLGSCCLCVVEGEERELFLATKGEEEGV